MSGWRQLGLHMGVNFGIYTDRNEHTRAYEAIDPAHVSFPTSYDERHGQGEPIRE